MNFEGIGPWEKATDLPHGPKGPMGPMGPMGTHGAQGPVGEFLRGKAIKQPSNKCSKQVLHDPKVATQRSNQQKAAAMLKFLYIFHSYQFNDFFF